PMHRSSSHSSSIQLFFSTIVIALPRPTLFPYTTLFRSNSNTRKPVTDQPKARLCHTIYQLRVSGSLASASITVSERYESVRSCKDRKSTRLNSSHVSISYAVFSLKKKKQNKTTVGNSTQ